MLSLSLRLLIHGSNVKYAEHAKWAALFLTFDAMHLSVKTKTKTRLTKIHMCEIYLKRPEQFIYLFYHAVYTSISAVKFRMFQMWDVNEAWLAFRSSPWW